MFKIIKKYIVTGSIIIFILTLLWASLLYNQLQTAKSERDRITNELEVKTSDVVRYKNKTDQVVTQVNEYVKTLDELKNSTDSIENALWKRLQASNLENRQLKAAISVVIKSKVVIEKDTTYVIETVQILADFPIAYNNKFTKALCYPDSLKLTTYRSIDLFDASRKVPRKLQPFKWMNKNWELNKLVDEGMVEIVSSNPNDVIDVTKVKILN